MKRTNRTKLCKIVYFDEESITDYIQIIAGGQLEKTSELFDQSADTGDAAVQAKGSIGVSRIFKSLLGIEASVSTEGNLGLSFNSERIARNIVKNTILTDFVEIITPKDSKNSEADNNSISRFEGYRISAPKDSLTYVALISPYLSMLKSGTSIPAGDFSIAADRLDHTIKSAKGYYEFLAEKDLHRVILRFNINSFKNNYKATDLIKMELSIFAIRVGVSSVEQLNVNSELGIHSAVIDNPTYSANSNVKASPGSDELLELYDVVLAGVESRAAND